GEGQPDVGPATVLEREDDHVLIVRGRRRRGAADAARAAGSTRATRAAGSTRATRATRASRAGAGATVLRTRRARLAVIAAVVAAKVVDRRGCLGDLVGRDVDGLIGAADHDHAGAADDGCEVPYYE